MVFSWVIVVFGYQKMEIIHLFLHLYSNSSIHLYL